MSTYKPYIYRVSTGIDELDEALEGGIPKGSWVAITGEPGTGKSIMSMHYAYRGLKDGDPVIYITTEAEFKDVVKQAQQFGMNFEEYEIHYLGGEPPKRRPNIVVIDIFSLLKKARQLTTELAEGERRRRFAALDIETLIAAITEAYQVLGVVTEGRRTPLRHVRLIIDSLSAFWADKPAMARKYSYQLKIATHRDNVTAYLVSQYAMTTKSVAEFEEVMLKLNNDVLHIKFKELGDVLGLNEGAPLEAAILNDESKIRIQSVDVSKMEVSWRPIRTLIKHRNDYGYVMVIETSRGEVLSLTRDHGVYITKDYTRAILCKPTDQVRRGDKILRIMNGKLSYDIVRNIYEVKYNGYVYDISVPKTENFAVSNGLIVHNSTFGFGLEHIADGVIHLWMDNVEETKEVRRYLIIKKMRMTNHYTGAFILSIEPGRGIVLKKI